MPSSVEISSRVLERGFSISVNVLQLFRYYPPPPSKQKWSFIWKKLGYPQSKDEIGQRVLEKSMKLRITMDIRRSEKLTWVFSTGELKLYLLLGKYFPKKIWMFWFNNSLSQLVKVSGDSDINETVYFGFSHFHIIQWLQFTTSSLIKLFLLWDWYPSLRLLWYNVCVSTLKIRTTTVLEKLKQCINITYFLGFFKTSHKNNIKINKILRK